MNYFRLFKRLARIHIKTSMQQELAFRLDFFVRLLNTMLGILGSVGGILIIYTKVDTINGWGIYETLAVTGMFMLIQSLKGLFIGPSLNSISGMDGELWTGKFDYTLLKPIPSQLYISIKKWSPMVILDLIISLIIIGIALFNVQQTMLLLSLVKFIIAFTISLLFIYSIMILLASVAFWYLGTPLLWIFDSLVETGRYPVSIYPLIFRFILTWIIPVGFIVTVPAEALIGKANTHDLILGGIFALSLYFISTLFYKRSVKKYSSASS